ncbi:A nuclease family of the HNH/ENDO VII superfamily with conserved AHH [Alteromonadaceae bacterium Bs31]|nr:A nuclease family of the HNH/ENDO VII superfamily with conserved AHH [Alteromonadaceae bacterium Bs31]
MASFFEYTHPDYGNYEFQAHHLVSGKQALQDHKVEQWIAKSEKKIEEDTGYTINGSQNGLWAPSWPKSFRSGAHEGKWTDPNTDTQEIANRVMKLARCQFHLGAHNIGDPLDAGQVRHLCYDSWLKKELTRMYLRMWGWSRVGPACCEDGERKKPPFQPNERINRALNRLSSVAKQQLTTNRKRWFTFLSRLALNYHEEVCGHPIPGKKSVRS